MILGLERPSFPLSLVGEGLCLPHILHPHLNCEGIRICNDRLKRGCRAGRGHLLRWPLKLGRGQAGPGRLWMGRGKAPCLGVGWPGSPSLEAWGPAPSRTACLASEGGTSPSQASVSILGRAVLGGGEGALVMLCDFKFPFLIPGSFKMKKKKKKHVRCHRWGRGLGSGQGLRPRGSGFPPGFWLHPSWDCKRSWRLDGAQGRAPAPQFSQSVNVCTPAIPLTHFIYCAVTGTRPGSF